MLNFKPHFLTILIFLSVLMIGGEIFSSTTDVVARCASPFCSIWMTLSKSSLFSMFFLPRTSDTSINWKSPIRLSEYFFISFSGIVEMMSSWLRSVMLFVSISSPMHFIKCSTNFLCAYQVTLRQAPARIRIKDMAIIIQILDSTISIEMPSAAHSQVTASCPIWK